MNFKKELYQKATSAKSAEDLIALAKEDGVDLTLEQAKSYYARLHAEGELADDELNDVAGGCSLPYPSYRPDAVAINRRDPRCPACGSNKLRRDAIGGPIEDQYDQFTCLGCGSIYRHYFQGDQWTLD